MATVPSTKRIVVHIVKGRLAGMAKIIGHLVLDEAQAAEAFPPAIEPVDLGDHTGKVIHAGTFERYVLYREWAQPISHRFGLGVNKDNFDTRQA